MKYLEKLIAASLILAGTITNGQTNVNGGIYVNTTWSKANSPYIITGSVVLFQGLILTIEPGVEVRFDDNTDIEIRNATLIANGTSSDSITFTSNSVTPHKGSWNRIHLYIGNGNASQFNYCNFKYGYKAITNIAIGNLTEIRNSKFTDNNYALFNDSYYCEFLIDSCQVVYNDYGLDAYEKVQIYNSVFSHNYSGITFWREGIVQNCAIDSNTYRGIAIGYDVSLSDCHISHDSIGLESGSAGIGNMNTIGFNTIEFNDFGIRYTWHEDIISCNKIADNLYYNVYYTVHANNADLGYNNWGTSDSAIIRSKIYDGYVDLSLGLITFMPIDTNAIVCHPPIGVQEINDYNISIYPNPAKNYLQINSENNEPISIKLFDLFGRPQKSSVSEAQQDIYFIDISYFTSGIYFIELTIDNKKFIRKFVKE